jgi:hypothetical protein
MTWLLTPGQGIASLTWVMSGRRKSTKASSRKDAASRSISKLIAAPPAPQSPPGEPFLAHKYQELVRKHLGKLLDALFADFTGVHFQVAWTPALPRHWDARTLPTGCSVCCRLTGSAGPDSSPAR